MAKRVRLLYGFYTESKTIAATTEATGFPATAAVDLDRSSTWKANANGTQNLTVDLGAATACTGLGLANHNLGAITGTQELRASTDNFAVSNVLIKTLAPGSSGDYYATFNSASYRYWRVVTNASGSERAYIGEFYLGTVTELTENPSLGFFEEDVWQDLQSTSISGVQVIKQTGRQTRYFRGKWTPTTDTVKGEVRTVLLAQSGRLKPFFYIPRADASDPTEGTAYFVRLAQPRWTVEEVWNSTWSFGLDLEEQV